MHSEFIHKFVPAAAKSASSGRTLLLLHGTGGDEGDLLPIGAGVAPGFAMLSPRGLVDENGMARFFRRLREGVFDEHDIRLQAAKLEKFLLDAAQEYGFDSSGLVALGYSNGANMAAAMLLLYPGILSAAVLMRATLPLAPEPLLPIAASPVLILAGEHDSMLPAPGTEKLAQTLTYAGAKVEVRWHNLGHELGPEDFAAARDFLKKLG